MNFKYSRKFGLIIYPTAFLLFFIFGFYCCFPQDMLRENIENVLTNQIYKLYNQDRGTPNIKVKSASLWRISGIDAREVNILWPPLDDKPQTTILLNKLQARMGIFALLKGHKNIIAKIDAYGANAYTNFYIDKSNNINYARLDLTNLRVNKLPIFLESPIGGILDIKADATAKTDMRMDGSGKLTIIGKSLEIGPGNMKVPGANFLGAVNLPKINLGKLDGNFSLEKGELISKNITLTTGDIESEANVNINIGPSLNTSKITGTGWFKIKPELISGNNTIKMLFDLIPELKAAKAGDGKVAFSIKGILKNPRFSLESK